MKTQIDYLASSSQCPSCNSDAVGTEGVKFSPTKIYRETFCSNCRKKWNEIYTLSGFELISTTKELLRRRREQELDHLIEQQELENLTDY